MINEDTAVGKRKDQSSNSGDNYFSYPLASHSDTLDNQLSIVLILIRPLTPLPHLNSFSPLLILSHSDMREHQLCMLSPIRPSPQAQVKVEVKVED